MRKLDAYLALMLSVMFINRDWGGGGGVRTLK